MPKKTYPCPCCDGQGLVHAESAEGEPLECAECDATGRVTKEHREALLEWRHKCRLRRPRADASTGGGAKAPRVRVVDQA